MGKFLDTNVVLDIIYPERPRSKDATAFYMKFKNYELKIENQVYKECQSLAIKYLNYFTADLQNFISTNDRHSKKWDLLDQKKRSKLLTLFLDNIKEPGKNHKLDRIPFYKSLINLSRHEIIYLNFKDLKDYLIGLASEVMRYLSEQIKTRFEYKLPYSPIEREDIIKFKTALLDSLRASVFKRDQIGDVYILSNIIHLLLYGDSDGNKYSEIVLFTYDKDFLNNFTKIKESPPEVIQGYLEKNYPEILGSLSLEYPDKIK